MCIYTIMHRPVVFVEKDIADSEVDRNALIKKVIAGDAEAAYELSRFYAMTDIPEACLYWMKMAKTMGKSNVFQEIIDACERSILNEHREPER